MNDRVLVLEDEDRLRELLIDQLPAMGYRPRGARTAEEARRLLAEEPADILLLDLNLPVMGGLDFLDVLTERWPRTRVIIMTGFGDLDAAKKAIHHGVVEFLTKPYHLGEIEQALSRARLQLLDREAPASVGTLPASADFEADDDSPPRTLAETEKKLILDALRRHEGNRTATAEELGISRRTLYNKLQQYGYEGEAD